MYSDIATCITHKGLILSRTSEGHVCTPTLQHVSSQSCARLPVSRSIGYIYSRRRVISRCCMLLTRGARSAESHMPLSFRQPACRRSPRKLHPAVPCAGLHGRRIHVDVGFLQRDRGGRALFERIHGCYVGHWKPKRVLGVALPTKGLCVRGNYVWTRRDIAVVSNEV
jgi:hypothetical protein